MPRRECPPHVHPSQPDTGLLPSAADAAVTAANAAVADEVFGPRLYFWAVKNMPGTVSLATVSATLGVRWL